MQQSTAIKPVQIEAIEASAPIAQLHSAALACIQEYRTPTGLKLPQGLDFDLWDEIGRELAVTEQVIQWRIGDWLNYGEREYGETYQRAAAVTLLAPKTLQNYAYVANAVEPSRRRDNLDFSTHAEVAALPPAQQDALLTQAAQSGLTTREIRQLVRMNRAQGKAKSENRLFLNTLEEKRVEWEAIKQRLLRFAEGLPGASFFLNDFVDDVDRCLVLKYDNNHERITSTMAFLNTWTFDELRKATGLSEDALNESLDWLISRDEVQTYEQGGKTDGARGARKTLYALAEAGA